MSTATKKTAKQWEIGQIMETLEYDRFTFIPGNRPVDPNHVEYLKKKMSNNYLVAPIMCNKDLGIMDGQHRYIACQQLELPIRYYITDDMAPEEIAGMNNVAKRWKPENYANVYNTEHYRAYRTFRQSYPKLVHTTAVILLAGGDNTVSGDDVFKTGHFKVKNYNKAVKTAELLMHIGEYTRVYSKRSFVYALLHIMSYKEYDEKRLMRKIKHKSKVLKDYSRTDDFIQALQDMYNWMEPAENKVSFVKL